ncbi:MAG: hypothetical protein H0T79_21810, partial [Deltaproteobacteria bacterium]|nr:hypothetical protein [Deltaproteobacteria bacterium]
MLEELRDPAQKLRNPRKGRPKPVRMAGTEAKQPAQTSTSTPLVDQPQEAADGLREGEPRGDLDRLATPRIAAAPETEEFVAPPQVEFIADAIGRLAKVRVPIARRAAKGHGPNSGPTIIASTNNDLFSIIAAPNLLPASDELAPHNHFVLGFGAQTPGRFDGVLSVRTTRPPHSAIQVSLVGYADPSAKPPTPPSVRRLALPHDINLGEHIVGSTRMFDIAQMQMAEPGWADIGLINIINTENMKSTVGEAPLRTNHAAAFYRSTNVTTRITDKHPRPLDIGFAPGHAGQHKAMLEVPITWADGVVTKQYVTISGRARELTQAPAEGLGDVPLDPKAKPVHQDLELNGDPNHDFDLVAETSHNTAESIARSQIEGLRDAERDCAGYSKKLPDTSLLTTLAEMALTMATSGIAGVFAKTVSNALGKHMVGSSHGKPSDLPEAIAANDAIKEGLKFVAKKNIEKVKDPGTRPTTHQAAGSFFDAQRKALLASVAANAQLITQAKHRLKPLLPKQPALVLASMRATQLALETTDAEAYNQQLIASLSQYFVAAAGGADGVLDKNLSAVRARPDSPFVVTNGMLRARVEMQPDGSISLTSATISGVSRHAVDHFHSVVLKSIPIPMVVLVTSKLGQGAVSRDEKGVIRVGGTLANTRPDDHEANKVDKGSDLLD